jgi:hypothetical protein
VGGPPAGGPPWALQQIGAATRAVGCKPSATRHSFYTPSRPHYMEKISNSRNASGEAVPHYQGVYANHLDVPAGPSLFSEPWPRAGHGAKIAFIHKLGHGPDRLVIVGQRGAL